MRNISGQIFSLFLRAGAHSADEKFSPAEKTLSPVELIRFKI
jgi:hypothetical protein